MNEQPRYVELVRVSTSKQEEAGTPENQRKALDRLRTQRPGVLLDRIEALAISGATPLDQTAQGRALRALAQQGMDELRVWDIDRCLGARADDPRDRLAILSIVMDASAVIVDCRGHMINPLDESGMGELDYYLRTFFAAQERKKIVARTRAGRQRAAENGRVSSPPKYGFVRDESNRPVVEPGPAEVVRRMFALRAEGLSYNRIAERLLAEGVPSPRGAMWPHSTLHNVLRDPAYRGEYHHDGSVIEVEPIVEPALWHAVQAVGSRARRKTRRADALCKGRIVCACGRRAYTYPSGGRLGFYYGCQSLGLPAFRCEKCDDAKRHRVTEIDAAVWETLVEVVTEPDVLRAAIDADTGEEDRDGNGFRDELDRCDALLDRLTRDEVDLGRSYRRRLISREAWEVQQRDIARERKTLEASRELARQQIAALEKRSRSVSLASVKLDELRERIRGAGSEDRRAIFEALVPAEEPYGVVLHGDGRVEVRGVLAVGAAAAHGGGRKRAKPQRIKSFSSPR